MRAALDDLFSDDTHADKKQRTEGSVHSTVACALLLHRLSADRLARCRLGSGLEFFSDLSNPMVMKTYYTRLFPFKPTFHWLNQSRVPSRNFTHREFALTLQNDVYIRYNSFANADDFKDHVVRLNPARFEIGPVYSNRPKDRKSLMKAALKPVLRELVFDIDMTDCEQRPPRERRTMRSVECLSN